MENKNIGFQIFFWALQLLFITLKLIGELNWSWFWVLSPAIFSAFFGLASIVVAAIILSRNKKKIAKRPLQQVNGGDIEKYYF